MDSAHRIGLFTISKGVLTIDERVCGWRFDNRMKNRTRNLTYSLLYRHKQGPYIQTDKAIRFSILNRSIYPLEGCSDYR